jgi:hypothetical protein
MHIGPIISESRANPVQQESVFATSVEHFFDSIDGHAPSCKRRRRSFLILALSPVRPIAMKPAPTGLACTSKPL